MRDESSQASLGGHDEKAKLLPTVAPAPVRGPALPVASFCFDLSGYGSTADAALLVASAPLERAPGPSVQVLADWLYSSL